MDYEKAYKEALERAKAGKPLNEVFPELKVSEDEMTRNEIIAFIEQAIHSGGGTSIPKQKEDRWIAYLEKQKEYKSFNDTQEYLKGVARVQDYDELTKFEKVFDRIADTYAHRKNKDGYNEPWYTKERAAEMLYHAKEELGLLVEQKPAEWSKEDKHRLEQAINALGRNGYYVLVDWLQFLPERFNPQPKQEWSEKDERLLRITLECLDYISCQSKTSVVGWLRALPERIDLQPKQEWNWDNEDFEKFRTVLAKEAFLDEITSVRVAKKLLGFLKHCRPQPHWKPSKEQMDALHKTVCGDDHLLYRDTLIGLYQQLKQL